MNKSILSSLAYAQVFSWPLKENEFNSENNDLSKLLKEKKIETKDGYYYLPGNEKNIKNRTGKEKYIAGKMRTAERAAGFLKIIPSILLVGVSGGLAVGNADKNDDIDFFIICKTGTLWTTRFLATLLLDLLGMRRQPGNNSIRDKICLNMFVDETGVTVPAQEQDIFTAHEVVQMKPLLDKNIYKKFMGKNSWIKKFL